jgi:hypothetical protein
METFFFWVKLFQMVIYYLLFMIYKMKLIFFFRLARIECFLSLLVAKI